MQNGTPLHSRAALVYRELVWNRITERLAPKDGDAEIRKGTKLCKIIGKSISTTKKRQLG